MATKVKYISVDNETVALVCALNFPGKKETELEAYWDEDWKLFVCTIFL